VLASTSSPSCVSRFPIRKRASLPGNRFYKSSWSTIWSKVGSVYSEVLGHPAGCAGPQCLAAEDHIASANAHLECRGLHN
jgi:hypothetical protein